MPITARIDELGRPAWIALMVLGFIIFWPLGLATLAFLIWSGRMGCWNHHGMDRWQGRIDRMQAKMDRMRSRMEGWGGRMEGWAAPRRGGSAPSSGNRAFDDYRAETLRRLEEEQQEFRDFLDRLRMAKDKSEFDQFMAERRNRPQPTNEPPQPQQNSQNWQPPQPPHGWQPQT